MASTTKIEGIMVVVSATEIKGITVMGTKGRIMRGVMVGPGPATNRHQCLQQRMTVPFDTKHLRLH